MSGLQLFIENMNYLVLIDILVALIVTIGAYIFFRKNRKTKIFLWFLLVVVVTASINIFSELSGKGYLYIASITMNLVVAFFILAIAVVYQIEIRSLFYRIGRTHLDDIYSGEFGSDDELRTATAELVTAIQNMAKNDVGALILLVKSNLPAHILKTGTELNAKLSSPLIESVFNTKAPLHDGAVVIKGNKILSAGCFLPLTQSENVQKDLGTRHRAAIGMTEESDVMAIVVSEETGIISIMKHGKMIRYITTDKLKQEIEEAYGISFAALSKKKNDNYKRQIIRKRKKR